MVVAESAHAAFHKAAHLFGIELKSTPVLPTGRPTSTRWRST